MTMEFADVLLSDETSHCFQPHLPILIGRSSADPCFSDAASDLHALIRREFVLEFQICFAYLQATINGRHQTMRKAHDVRFLRIKNSEISIHTRAEHTL